MIYSKDVIDFVKLAADYCLKLEHSREATPRELVKAMLNSLPYLYIKGTALLETTGENDLMSIDPQVTEEDYNFVRNGVYDVLGRYDEYLDVFVEDMKYSDKPILRSVSEDLADIYQDLRNFLAVYRDGIEEMMTAALYEVLDNFKEYWGQKCVNVMRALHDILYQQMTEEEY
ncbi:MAG: DUF5063 domain-containing protein [Bacteroidaceae bacterium]|nr:DUF5063 domain-containing protein [Bacteroidaceae bacterium]MBR3733866.1 DUF5063 domain-containing protein [Bacteroidaceae bacterium]